MVINIINNEMNEDLQLVPLAPTISLRGQNHIKNHDVNKNKLRSIFDLYDDDNDGFLNIRDMKENIRNNQTDHLPKNIERQIIYMTQNTHINFNEFYLMSLQSIWLFTLKYYIIRYCQIIIPSPYDRNRLEVRSAEGQDVVDGLNNETEGLDELDIRFWPPPISLIVFSLLQILSFVIDVIFENDISTKKIGYSIQGPTAKIFIYNPYYRIEVWRFITYMFVHIGVPHITMNLIVQIFLGVALELVHSWWRVSLVYLAGVLAGSMATSVIDPKIYLAGASGGVYSLTFAYIITILVNWKKINYRKIPFFAFLIFFIITVGTTIYNHYTYDSDSISHATHISGAISGLFIGTALLHNIQVRPWEKILHIILIILYVLFIIIGIFIHIFNPVYYSASI